MLHFHFNTYLISLSKGLLILYSEMSIASSELEMILAVKFLEKELILNYLIIIAKTFESIFKSIR